MGSFWDGWLASESNDHDAIKVKRIYIDLNDGNLYDGILFSQIMYWHGRNRETGKPRLQIQRDGYLWLAKSYGDWWDECRINAATARKCIDRIVTRDLLIKRVWKFDKTPTLHIRVNIEAFEHQLNYLLQERASICPVVSDGNDTSGHIHVLPQVKSITETTSETTPESTEKKEIAPNGGSQPLLKEKRNGKPSKEEAIADTTHEITPRRDLHDVTERMLGLKSAAYPLIEKWVNFLTGNTPEYTAARKGEKARRNGVWYEYQIQPGMEAAEIGAFGRWYRSVHPGIDVPSKCDSMNLHVARFRAAPDHARMVEAYRRDLEVQAIRAAQPAPAPAPVDDEPITAEQRTEAAAMFEALTAKLGGK